MQKIKAPGHHNNQFTHGDTSTNTPPTQVDAAWLNDVQDELTGLAQINGSALKSGVQIPQELDKRYSQINHTHATHITLYVDSTVASSGDGLSWAGAFKTLDEAFVVCSKAYVRYTVFTKKSQTLNLTERQSINHPEIHIMSSGTGENTVINWTPEKNKHFLPAILYFSNCNVFYSNPNSVQIGSYRHRESLKIGFISGNLTLNSDLINSNSNLSKNEVVLENILLSGLGKIFSHNQIGNCSLIYKNKKPPPNNIGGNPIHNVEGYSGGTYVGLDKTPIIQSMQGTVKTQQTLAEPITNFKEIIIECNPNSNGVRTSFIKAKNTAFFMLIGTQEGFGGKFENDNNFTITDTVGGVVTIRGRR